MQNALNMARNSHIAKVVVKARGMCVAVAFTKIDKL